MATINNSLTNMRGPNKKEFFEKKKKKKNTSTMQPFSMCSWIKREFCLLCMLVKNDHNIVVGNTLLYHPLTLQRKAVKWQKEHTHTQ